VEAHASARSRADVLKRLGLNPAGGNYRTLAVRMSELGLAAPEGQGWSRGQTLGPRRSLEELLSYDSGISSHQLRVRLLKEGRKRHVCERCGLDEWLGGPIPLELDHVDGDPRNNVIENIRLLCPNCHALTPTYRGKNRGKPLYPNRQRKAP
jgi:hypothetical protein